MKAWLRDWPFHLVVFLLVILGLLNQWSAGGPHYFWRYLLFSFGGLVVYGIFIFWDYRRWALGKVFWLYLLYALLLAYLALTHRRWLYFGGFSLQPSEFAKPLLVVLLGLFLSGLEGEVLSLPFFLGAMGVVLLPALLIASTDLDQAFMIVLIGFTIVSFAGLSRRLILGLSLLALLTGFLVGPVLWHHLKPYQRARITAFLKPGKTQKRWSYQTQQALIAVGSGGLKGEGFGKGLSAKLHYLPAKHTDLAFAVWAEEWGFLGSTLLLTLYGVLLGLGLRAAYLARDHLGRFLAFGATACLFWQIFINLGGVIRLLPTASVPLPFLSYGGSAYLTNMILLGIIASVLKRRFSFM
ncbi:hypothetical protein FVE67_04500 [Thermosulfurimonas marina]|uniref:Probable peptidoglycan glycosyltransferase FtsW n=1 Tax=Thermosulfurimonas marina TaxID=2047767 RepID=A0A6H1WSF2_9BACT|nr:FtsW/RodA/SpoVE family cell cycle protein [Thermosulfurimonas marina]QJA06100.1 hypothetical protein FVE67_04500 [Thermosulfurimonas marina]